MGGEGVKLREFTETDWDGWTGCEPWGDGQDPYIAYGVTVKYWPGEEPDGVTVIVDSTGVGVWGTGEPGDDLWLAQSTKETAIGIAELVLSGQPIDYRVLVAMGFKEV